jgi:hypothetical protein
VVVTASTAQMAGNDEASSSPKQITMWDHFESLWNLAGKFVGVLTDKALPVAGNNDAAHEFERDIQTENRALNASFVNYSESRSGDVIEQPALEHEVPVRLHRQFHSLRYNGSLGDDTDLEELIHSSKSDLIKELRKYGIFHYLIPEELEGMLLSMFQWYIIN